MSETPKEKSREPVELPDSPSLPVDTDEGGYYYDDAHGYEKYVPDPETDNEKD